MRSVMVVPFCLDQGPVMVLGNRDQPRSQDFSLLNWVGNSKGKSPGNEVGTGTRVLGKNWSQC